MTRNRDADESGIKSPKSKFFCPLGNGIMWWRGLQYNECPLNPQFRDMPECKGCKLKVDKKWDEHKEDWKDKPVKKKRRRKKRNNRQGGKK